MGIAQVQEAPLVCHLGQQKRQVALGAAELGVGRLDSLVEFLSLGQVMGHRPHRFSRCPATKNITRRFSPL